MNPSRFDPAHVAIRPMDNSYLALQENLNGFAMFVSTVVVHESHVVKPKKIGASGLLRYLSGVFHAVEWERACSFFCMAFSTDRLIAQVWIDLCYGMQAELCDDNHRWLMMLSTSRQDTTMIVSIQCYSRGIVYQ